jgi:hypothetical protein
MMRAMNTYDVLHIVLGILASLGGGGAIVFGFSGYLGKMWADRALEKQKHEYAQQVLAIQAQLDLTTQTLAHLQKLSNESTFTKIAELWKALVSVETAFRSLPRPENALPLHLNPDSNYLTRWQERMTNRSVRFANSVTDANALWRAEMLFFPVELARLARVPLLVATDEQEQTFEHLNPFDTLVSQQHQEFFEARERRMVEFTSGINALLPTLQEYLRVKKVP